ncbi:hypothetical protein F441_18711 [Phytophthora nicotianae CJ01A1]|uniref:Uncharacterized protein n=1 Tax=Phytophthora nicotianae CJ01A1 TaxID=1317063 RepID=W2W3C5_PHYNI|nr:hypothetical protein F441_18711 [Phytophthora nicotianae CJ01A1]
MVGDGPIPAGLFGRYMTRDRCRDILRDLHFVDNNVDHGAASCGRCGPWLTRSNSASWLVGRSLLYARSMKECHIEAQHHPTSKSAHRISRGNFHRVRVIEAEEAKLRDQFDIFGVPKLPQQKADRCSSTESDNKTIGDTIDKLLISEATNSPRRSARQEPQYLYEPAIPVPSRAQGKL